MLRAENLSKVFEVRKNWLRRPARRVVALEELSLELDAGERLALVGESGSGKSTLGRLLVGLMPPTTGEIRFEGRVLATLPPAELRAARRQLQMVFQDASGSLDPRMRVGELLAEALALVSPDAGPQDSSGRGVSEWLAQVGLSVELSRRFPHQLSGGQRQRVALARALALNPRVMVADEAVAGLDASLKGQVVDLLAELSRRRRMTLVFITHDLATVPRVAERVAVLYCGRLVETAAVEEVLKNCRHPYTSALLAAVPSAVPRQKRPSLSGEPPDPLEPPAGCRFHPRCPWVESRCRVETPELREVGPGHWVACHLASPGLVPAGSPSPPR